MGESQSSNGPVPYVRHLPGASAFDLLAHGPATLLSVTGQQAQQQMADVTADLITNAGRRLRLLRLPTVVAALDDMDGRSNHAGFSSE
jgi:hypothetical protein